MAESTDAEQPTQPTEPQSAASSTTVASMEDTRAPLLRQGHGDEAGSHPEDDEISPKLGAFYEPHRTSYVCVFFFIIIPAAFGFVYYFMKKYKKPHSVKSASGSRLAVAPTILISIDGFRHDYLLRRVPGGKDPLAPTLQKLAKEGVLGEDGMQPVMPTKTFPNHWSLATGLYPESHGIIGNVMYNPVTKAWFHPQVKDAEWWKGEPIWQTLRNTPMVSLDENGTRHSGEMNYATASVFWVGSDVKAHAPNVAWPYDRNVPYDRRVDRTVKLLNGKASDLGRHAHFVSLYFDGVDRAGHLYGPNSDEVDTQIAKVDKAIASLIGKLGDDALKMFNFVIVSDHGMTEVSPNRTVDLTSMIKEGSVQDEVSSPFGMWLNVTVSADQVYGELTGRAKELGDKLQIYRRDNIPERWHLAHSQLLTEVVTLTKLGWMVKYPHQHLVPGADGVPVRTADTQSVLSSTGDHKGQHGFDNTEKDMQALFIARGPGFREGAKVKGMRSVDIYSMLCHMFSAAASPNNGSLEISRKFVLNESVV